MRSRYTTLKPIIRGSAGDFLLGPTLFRSPNSEAGRHKITPVLYCINPELPTNSGVNPDSPVNPVQPEDIQKMPATRSTINWPERSG